VWQKYGVNQLFPSLFLKLIALNWYSFLYLWNNEFLSSVDCWKVTDVQRATVPSSPASNSPRRVLQSFRTLVTMYQSSQRHILKTSIITVYLTQFLRTFHSFLGCLATDTLPFKYLEGPSAKGAGYNSLPQPGVHELILLSRIRRSLFLPVRFV